MNPIILLCVGDPSRCVGATSPLAAWALVFFGALMAVAFVGDWVGRVRRPS